VNYKKYERERRRRRASQEKKCPKAWSGSNRAPFKRKDEGQIARRRLKGKQLKIDPGPAFRKEKEE